MKIQVDHTVTVVAEDARQEREVEALLDHPAVLDWEQEGHTYRITYRDEGNGEMGELTPAHRLLIALVNI